jgi:hypothetical protein
MGQGCDLSQKVSCPRACAFASRTIHDSLQGTCEFLISSLCRTITIGTVGKALEIGSPRSRKSNARPNVGFPTLRGFLMGRRLTSCSEIKSPNPV